MKGVSKMLKHTVKKGKRISELFRTRRIYQGRHTFSKSVVHLKALYGCGLDSVEHGCEDEDEAPFFRRSRMPGLCSQGLAISLF